MTCKQHLDRKADRRSERREGLGSLPGSERHTGNEYAERGAPLWGA